MAASLDVVVCRGVPRNQVVAVISGGPSNVNDSVALYSGAGALYREKIIADGASAYWRLGDPSGTTAVDSIGTAHGVVASGVTLNQPGVIPDGNRSMTFTGTGQVTIAPGAYAAWGQGGASLECWIKAAANAASLQYVVDTKAAGSFNAGLALAVDVSYVYASIGNGTNADIKGASISYANNQWRHLVMVLTRGPQDTLTIYFDGIQVFSGPIVATGWDITSLLPCTIGAYSGETGTSSSHFIGGIDEVAIYKRSLTPAEVAAHYAIGSSPSSLIGWSYLDGTQVVPAVGVSSGTFGFSIPPVGRYLMQFKRWDTGEVYDTEPFEIKTEPQVCLEMEFLGKNNGWSIVRDWYRTPGLSWHRGLPGPGILDLIADVGTLNFTLDNSNKNSAGKLGYYSPDHGNRRYGFYLNIGVRVRVGSTVRFTGTLAGIDPVPGKYGARTVSCEVIDWMGLADRTKLENLPVLVNKRGDEVFNTLINSLPTSARPPTVQVDISPDTYPYTLDRTRDEQTVLRDELYRLCSSGLSRIYLLGDGTLVYEARGRRVMAMASIDTFSDSHGFAASHGRDTVINRVQTTIHPRIPGSVDVVMYALPQPIPLTPGLPVIILGPWTDPANPSVRVGAVSLVSLVRGTDYVANTLADGTGADLTAGMTVSAGLSGNATEFTVTSPSTGFITKLQQRGKPLYDYAEAVLRWEDTTSIAQFGVSPQQIDMPYTADSSLALEVAQFAVYNNAFPQTNISSFMRIVDLAHATEVQRSITRQISDRISISDLVTGVSRPFYIQAIDELITDGRIETQWSLTPADTTGYWLLEVPGFTELDFTTRLGFGQIIGHTDIPHTDSHGDVTHSDIVHSDTHTDNAHVDLPHADDNTHYDAASHEDIWLHNDVTHQDIAHSDGQHYDTAAVSWHQDQAHYDVAHEDWHADTPHEDVPHGDDHYDVAGQNFNDHMDCYPSYYYSHHDGGTHTMYNHMDCWSSGGHGHTDAEHYDNGGHSLFHNDYPFHEDVGHGDDHWDIHGDIYHGDHYQIVDHQDVPYLNNHGDVAHADIPHGDIVHTDVTHQDSYPHTDTASHSDTVLHSDVVHNDITHGDVAHTDVLHADIAHTDWHEDFHGDIN